MQECSIERKTKIHRLTVREVRGFVTGSKKTGKVTTAKELRESSEEIICKEIIEDQIEELSLKLADVDALIDEVTDIAYDKAVESLTDEVILQTHKEDIELVEGSIRWIQQPERKASVKERNYAIKRLEGVITKIKNQASLTLNRIRRRLMEPELKAALVLSESEKAECLFDRSTIPTTRSATAVSSATWPSSQRRLSEARN